MPKCYKILLLKIKIKNSLYDKDWLSCESDVTTPCNITL